MRRRSWNRGTCQSYHTCAASADPDQNLREVGNRGIKGWKSLRSKADTQRAKNLEEALTLQKNMDACAPTLRNVICIRSCSPRLCTAPTVARHHHRSAPMGCGGPLGRFAPHTEAAKFLEMKKAMQAKADRLQAWLDAPPRQQLLTNGRLRTNAYCAPAAALLRLGESRPVARRPGEGRARQAQVAEYDGIAQRNLSFVSSVQSVATLIFTPLST